MRSFTTQTSESNSFPQYKGNVLNFASQSADNNSMKKISAVCIFLFGFCGLLWSQAEESPLAEPEELDVSATTANIPPTTESNFRQEGVASWYGAEFAGRATASGEIFDPAQLTAAHAELPFGTYLIVTNTENGKKIAVRINDRGPFVRSRILDVSRSAAERLDMLTAGTAKVIIEATTRENAQSLVRELGVSTAAVARTPPVAAPPPAASSTAPRAASAPSGNTAAATPPPAASSTAPRAAPAPSGNTAAATPPPAASSTAPRTAPAPSGNTAAAPPPSASSTAPAASSDNTAPAASRTPAAAPSDPAATPVMAPTSPRMPPQTAGSAAFAPSPSVSRVTGQVENIPEIRRSSDASPGYVVVEEQVVSAPPPVFVPPASATPQTAAPVIPGTALPIPDATTVPPQPNAAPTVTPPAAPVSDTPQTTEPAVMPPAAPQTAEPPSQPNPAASVPVTNPQKADKVEFTGSQMVQGKNYRVQVGSFADLKNASEVFLRLFDAGLNPSYEHYDDKFYRVVITNVKAEDADDLSRKLAEIGITEALAREDASSR
jgi:rare lipoprotein A (peptidoglycan hydrolase)